MASQPEVTFVICTYNRAEYLDDTLQSLFPSDLLNLNFEVLIIDNNSQDHTPNVVQKYQKAQNISIRYAKETDQGLSHARNRGIKEASAPYIVFLDDDIRAAESLIPAWLTFFDKYPHAVAGGGKIHVQFDAPRPRWMSHFLLPLLGYHDLGNDFKKYPKTKYPFGGNMGFSKSIFDEVGIFNTGLGRKGGLLNAGEEKELFNRIREKGYSIYYLPHAFLFHRVGAGRLTIDYIHKQALGLGQSMKGRLAHTSLSRYLSNWISEIGKLIASAPLGLFYVLKGQPSKAAMLFKFRWWIWKGYGNMQKPSDKK